MSTSLRRDALSAPSHMLIREPKMDADFERFLTTRKASAARRRGATSEAYSAIRRNEERSKATPQMMP
jgi:hypothetical protein